MKQKPPEARVKIYLDNCCLNRPYDNQSSQRISLETQAILFIQELIRSGQVWLVTSYMSVYENSQNPHMNRKTEIENFLRNNAREYVSASAKDVIRQEADKIIATGIKAKDALHAACALYAKCDYLVTTDDRFLALKYGTLEMINPVAFVYKWESLCTAPQK